MANNQYSYNDILSGKGFWSDKAPAEKSDGVAQMQSELASVGYPAADAVGIFGPSTKAAVKGFQSGVTGLKADGIAGKSTLAALNKVKGSKYYKDFGKPIAAAEWNPAKLPSYAADDVIARIIYAEDTNNHDGQQGVARVIKNRSGNAAYRDSKIGNPYIAVVAKASQYSTAKGNTNACSPKRGRTGASDGINPYWKSAVDLAEAMTSGGSLPYPSGKAIEGMRVTSSKRAITAGHYMQIGKSKYAQYVQKGRAMAQVLTFEDDLDGSGNVFFLK